MRIGSLHTSTVAHGDGLTCIPVSACPAQNAYCYLALGSVGFSPSWPISSVDLGDRGVHVPRFQVGVGTRDGVRRPRAYSTRQAAARVEVENKPVRRLAGFRVCPVDNGARQDDISVLAVVAYLGRKHKPSEVCWWKLQTRPRTLEPLDTPGRRPRPRPLQF